MKHKFTWQSAFMDSDLHSTTKLVLFVISSFMNAHGDGAFPTISTISKKSSLSIRAVKKHIPIAVEVGWLIKYKHGFSGKKWATNEYNISFPDLSVADITNGAPDAPHKNNVVHDVPDGGAYECNNVVHQVPTNRPVNRPVNKGDVGFEEWWSIYPRKIGKGAAKKSYKKAIKKISHSDLIVITNRYQKGVSGTDKQFIPHPATWLNQERWSDEPETKTHLEQEKPDWLV